jgi:hypothetical protein
MLDLASGQFSALLPDNCVGRGIHVLKICVNVAEIESCGRFPDRTGVSVLPNDRDSSHESYGYPDNPSKRTRKEGQQNELGTNCPNSCGQPSDPRQRRRKAKAHQRESNTDLNP